MEITLPCLIAIQHIDDMDEEIFHHSLLWLPEDLRHPMLRFRRKEDRDRALLGALLMRYALSQTCSLPFKDIKIQKNEYGKPSLSACHRIHFNLSHAGEWIVLLISEHPVGVDVEQINSIDLTGMDLFFSKREWDRLSSYEGQQKLDCFYDLWTLKESYMKALGLGMSLPPNSFWISYDPCITVQPHQGDQHWHFKQYALSPDYKLSACSASPSFPTEICRLASGHFIDLVASHISEMEKCIAEPPHG